MMSLDALTPSLLQALAYIGRLALRLIPLLIISIFLADLARMWLGEERLRRALTGGRPWQGRLRGVLLGAALPFCECGAFPVLIGLIRAGVPLGIVVTFFLVSPVVSVPAFLILTALFGLVPALYYLAVTVAGGLAGGLLLELAGAWRPVLKDDFLDSPCCPGPPPEEACCPDPRLEDSCCARSTKNAISAPELLAPAWLSTKATTLRILPYTVAAMALASVMHTYIPPQVMEHLLSFGGPYAIPIAAAAGIPIYSGDSTMIAFVAPFMGATGAVGPAIAFVIAGAGTSLNGIVFMGAVFRPRFVILYVIVLFLIAVFSGYALTFITWPA